MCKEIPIGPLKHLFEEKEQVQIEFAMINIK